MEPSAIQCHYYSSYTAAAVPSCTLKETVRPKQTMIIATGSKRQVVAEYDHELNRVRT